MTHDPLIWAEARQRLPLPELLAALGDGRFREKKAECPFCGLKPGARGAHGGWSLFKKAGRDFFKCHNPECAAHEPDAGNSEIGYLALRKGLPGKEAAKEYLRLALPERVFDESPEEKGTPTDRKTPPRHPGDGPANNVWHDLWQRLPLTAEDHAALMEKRGFSPETIALHGIRSNKLAYKPIVEALAGDYPLSLLLAEGIFKEEGRAHPGPIGQFYGYGITDEKDEHGKAIFALTEPPIIPYFDKDGTPFYLRPHKGGVKKLKADLADIQIFEDEDDGAQCAAEVFVPLGTAELVELHDGRCILTEGEFKAIAGAQAGVPIIAAPGVSFIRNPEFRRKLEAALDRLGVTELVIIFDNEVKNDPAFPRRYKPDPWLQWDTQVYAEYTLRELRPWAARNRGTVRVGALPDALRIEGKADFDGILAACVEKDGLEAGTKAARKIFRRALEEATGAPTADLFPSESRRIIECKVERMFHRPRVAVGGKREAELARRFAAYDPETASAIDKELAAALEECLGCYYLRKSPEKDARAALGKLKDDLKKRIEELETQLKNAEAQRLADPKLKVTFTDGQTAAALRAQLRLLYGRLAATWERLKGVPAAISTFTLSCEHKLHTPGGTQGESVNLLVRVTRRRSGRMISEKKLRVITPQNISRLADFREWCRSIGDATFGGSGGGGDKDLQDLTIDLDHQSYLRDIHELDTCGHHPGSRTWFFGDCAFPPKTRIIHADKNGVFWHEGHGYQFSAPGSVAGESFCQGLPLLLSPQDRALKAGNPRWIAAVRAALAEDVRGNREALVRADAMLNLTEPGDAVALIESAHSGVAPRLRTAFCAGLFEQISEDLFNTIGGYDGWTMLGILLAYAIAPELCQQDGHPGLWLIGSKGSGKTTVGRWLMRIWGFKELRGQRLGPKDTSPVALNRILTQYDSLPLLLDEYRQETVDPAIEGALRGAFDRSSGAKGIAA